MSVILVTSFLGNNWWKKTFACPLLKHRRVGKERNREKLWLLQSSLRYTQTQQELGDNLSFCLLKPFLWSQLLSSLVAIRLMKVKELVFQIITWSHVIRRSYNFNGGSLFAYFAVHGSSTSGNIMYFIRHVISQEHLIEGSFKYAGGSSLDCVTTLTGLVIIAF